MRRSATPITLGVFGCCPSDLLFSGIHGQGSRKAMVFGTADCFGSGMLNLRGSPGHEPRGSTRRSPCLHRGLFAGPGDERGDSQGLPENKTAFSASLELNRFAAEGFCHGKLGSQRRAVARSSRADHASIKIPRLALRSMLAMASSVSVRQDSNSPSRTSRRLAACRSPVR